MPNFDFDPKQLERLADKKAIRKVVTEVLKNTVASFRRTTKGWKHKVSFHYEFEWVGDEFYATVYTNDIIYGYVNNGVRPHFIPIGAKGYLRYRSKYSPSTTVGKLKSQANVKYGSDVIIREGGVWHYSKRDGDNWSIKPRRFDSIIMQQSAKRLERQINKWLTTVT